MYMIQDSNSCGGAAYTSTHVHEILDFHLGVQFADTFGATADMPIERDDGGLRAGVGVEFPVHVR